MFLLCFFLSFFDRLKLYIEDIPIVARLKSGLLYNPSCLEESAGLVPRALFLDPVPRAVEIAVGIPDVALKRYLL